MKVSSILILACFFVCACSRWEDVENKRGNETIIDPNLIKGIDFIGKSEADIISTFGKNYSNKLTFDPSLKKKIWGKEYNITRIIHYSFNNVECEDLGFAKTQTTAEHIDLAFFFDNNQVLNFTINHIVGRYVGDVDHYPQASVYRRGIWPDANCDFIFYERKVKKIIYRNKAWRIMHWTQDRCYWETDEDWADRNYGKLDYSD